jgi:CheY-like chemotaxis protein
MGGRILKGAAAFFCLAKVWASRYTCAMAEALKPRVLIVEDEMIVAMFLEDVLAELGYPVAGTVSTIEDGLAKVGEGDFDVALLDVHVAGKEVFPLADRLAENDIRMIFATGYGERGLPDRYKGRPVLQKPFSPDELKKALAAL